MLVKFGLSSLALLLSVGVTIAAPPNGINSTAPKTDPAGGYPAGQAGIRANGTYTCPPNKTIVKVVVRIYRQDAGGTLTFVGEVADPNPANMTYTPTNYLQVDSTKKYTGISIMYVQAANPANDPVQFGVTGSFIDYTP